MVTADGWVRNGDMMVCVYGVPITPDKAIADMSYDALIKHADVSWAFPLESHLEQWMAAVIVLRELSVFGVV